jgi:hypothetical protein
LNLCGDFAQRCFLQTFSLQVPGQVHRYAEACRSAHVSASPRAHNLLKQKWRWIIVLIEGAGLPPIYTVSLCRHSRDSVFQHRLGPRTKQSLTINIVKCALPPVHVQGFSSWLKQLTLNFPNPYSVPGDICGKCIGFTGARIYQYRTR